MDFLEKKNFLKNPFLGTFFYKNVVFTFVLKSDPISSLEFY